MINETYFKYVMEFKDGEQCVVFSKNFSCAKVVASYMRMQAGGESSLELEVKSGRKERKTK